MLFQENLCGLLHKFSLFMLACGFEQANIQQHLIICGPTSPASGQSTVFFFYGIRISEQACCLVVNDEVLTYLSTLARQILIRLVSRIPSLSGSLAQFFPFVFSYNIGFVSIMRFRPTFPHWRDRLLYSQFSVFLFFVVVLSYEIRSLVLTIPTELKGMVTLYFKLRNIYFMSRHNKTLYNR